ncbi:MAG: hypothetical protein R3Y09_07265 [Clostridia bacterium]
MPKENLLNLGRTPTLDELREFFQKNDWSSATYKDIDYDKMGAEETESLEYIKSIMDEHFEPLSREMGLKSDSSYYGKDNPLIAMRDNLENLVATGVMKLLYEQPEKVEDIFEHFFTESALEQPEQFEKNVDDMLHNAVKLTMQTMNYEEVAKVVSETSTYEDFNHDKYNNYRSKDFDRKWNHTRSKITTDSIEALQEKAFENSDHQEEIIEDVSVNIEEQVSAKLLQETFWNSISDDDKKILQMRMAGLTQKEIAEQLGYKTHSAITKRLQKLKEQFIELSA